MAGALLGSIALGLGYGLVLWSFGGLSGAQTNPSHHAHRIRDGRGSLGEAREHGYSRSSVGPARRRQSRSQLAPLWAAGDATVAGARGLGEAMASFGFVLVALGVAQRRDVKVPLALGAFATASFWTTGHATVGNPLLVLLGLRGARRARHRGLANRARRRGARCRPRRGRRTVSLPALRIPSFVTKSGK